MNELARTRMPLLIVALLCIVSVVYALMRMAWAIVFAPERAWKLSVGFDQLANAAGNGDPDGTISSRACKAKLAGRRWGCMLCKLLDKLDPGHCDRSIERDRGRRVP